MKYDLSIIVPVYNSEMYIERTVNALLTQEDVDYEIILVDDGSKDNSPTICDELSVKYANIRCYHCLNSGPGAARNYGIQHSIGHYIAFCDADDLPEPNMYGTLLSDLKREGVDYALCDIYTERDQKSFGFPWPGNKKFSQNEVNTQLLASMLGNLSDNDTTQPIWGSSVRCIYKRDILVANNIKFPTDVRFAEDLVFNIRYIKNIKSCFIRNEALYRYTFNTESLMNSYSQYNQNVFTQRIKLVQYILQELAGMEHSEDLLQRFQTSQRCYFVECVGNASRALKTRGFHYSLCEIRDIVNHTIVKDAYLHFDSKSFKKSISYWLIQKKCAALLLLYYAIRLRLS